MRKRLLPLALVVLAVLSPIVAGGAAVAAPPGNNSTAGNDTATNTTAGDAPRNVTSARPLRAAELVVEQPHYIDTRVEVDAGQQPPVYYADGRVLELRLRDVAQSQVLEYGVVGDRGTLQYDPATGEYTLRTGGQNGTYTLYWIVAERVTVPTGNNSTTTEVRQVRYEARLQIGQATFKHVTPSRWEQLQDKAANWSEVKEAFAGVGPEWQSVGEKLQEALDAYRFLTNPLRALSGNATATIIMLTWTNGGRLVLALILLFVVAAVAPVYYKYRQERRLRPEIESIDREKMKLWREKRRKQLVEKTPHDLEIDGKTADRMARHFGENLWKIMDTTFRLLDWPTIKRVILQAMGRSGYAARYRTDDSGTITDAELVDQSDDEADLETATDGGSAATPADDGDGATWQTDDLTDPSRELVTAIDDQAVDPAALDDSVALEDVDAPLKPDDLDHDLVADMGVEIPEDFDSREHLAECLGKVMKEVCAHSYTDEDGRIREEQSVLNLLGNLMTVTNERYDIPAPRYYRDVFFWLADKWDQNARIESAADESGHGSIDLNTSLDGDVADADIPGDSFPDDVDVNGGMLDGE